MGIVNRELAATMGEGVSDINLPAQPPAVILMAGLQGAGKTTTTAKLAKHLIEKRKKKVLTVSGDVYRPAAIEQLKTVTQAGRRRMVPEHAGPEAGGHRARRARPRQAPVSSTCCWSTPPAAWRSTRP